MRRGSRGIFNVLILVGLFFCAVLSARAQVSFRGRLFVGGARGGAVNIRIDIESYSSPEELQLLKQHLGPSDIDGFFGAFRAMKKGAIRYLGGEGLNIGLNAALERPTEKGIQVLLMTETRSAVPGVRKPNFRGFRFLVIVLDLDEKNKGDGTIYEDAKIRFTSEGFEIESSYSTPLKIGDVRLAK